MGCGQIALAKTDCDPGDVLQQAIDTMRSVADAGGVRLSFQTDVKLPRVSMDANRGLGMQVSGSDAGKDGSNDLVAQHAQGRDGVHAGRGDLIVTRASELGDQLLAAEFLQIPPARTRPGRTAMKARPRSAVVCR